MERCLPWLLCDLIIAGCGAAEPKPMIDDDVTLDHWDGLGVPLIGDLHVRTVLGSRDGKLSTASGTFEVTCTKCRLGDGVTTLKPTGSARTGTFFDEGITLPTISIPDIAGSITFTNGRGIVALRAGGAPQLEVAVSGTIELRASMGESTIDLRIVMRSGPQLAKDNPRADAMIMMIAPRNERGDVELGVTGTVAHPRAHALR